MIGTIRFNKGAEEEVPSSPRFGPGRLPRWPDEWRAQVTTEYEFVARMFPGDRITVFSVGKLMRIVLKGRRRTDSGVAVEMTAAYLDRGPKLAPALLARLVTRLAEFAATGKPPRKVD